MAFERTFFFPLAICYVSKRYILFSFPCPSNNNDPVTFKRVLYIFVPCLLHHWEGPSFLSSPYSVCDDKLWALMTVFIHRFYSHFLFIFPVGLDSPSSPCPILWCLLITFIMSSPYTIWPQKCHHHVSSNIVVVIYKTTRCHYPADHSLKNVSSSSPSHYNFNMSHLLSPFF